MCPSIKVESTSDAAVAIATEEQPTRRPREQQQSRKNLDGLVRRYRCRCRDSIVYALRFGVCEWSLGEDGQK